MVNVVDPQIALDGGNRQWNVLVADADEDSLLSLEKAFQECNHKVTKCNGADQCLATLQEKKGEFDLVIIEVSMPEIDGYELSRRIRKETDIPIILMSSAYSSDDSVPKVLECGASDFLLKPIKAEIVRNIDLDLLRNLIRQDSSCGEEEQDVSASISPDMAALVVSDEPEAVNTCSVEKRSGDSIAGLDPPARKKQRVIWCQELHEKFVSAVTKFGLERAVPKKIMEVMNVPGLTRENVASHLQKYRQYHKKQQGDSHKKQPSRRQQENQQNKQSEAMSENHVLKALYPESALTHASAIDEPSIRSDGKVRGGFKIGCQQASGNWADDAIQQKALQSTFLDHSSSYQNNLMLPTYDRIYDPSIDWKQQQTLPNFFHSIDTSNGMLFQPLPLQMVDDQSTSQLPNGISGTLLPQYEDELTGYLYDDHVSGLPMVPKIEHNFDHLDIQMVGNMNLQGNNTMCYNYATTSIDSGFYQGEHVSFNATSIRTASFDHSLYHADQQPCLVNDGCQNMYSISSYYDPSLYADQANDQGGPVMDQTRRMDQESVDEEIGFEERHDDRMLPK